MGKSLAIDDAEEGFMSDATGLELIERDDYADLFAGLGDADDEKVLLYRIAKDSQKQAILCRLDPGTSVEDIPPRFGGGDYIIKRLRSGMIVKSARLFVEGEPRVEQPRPDVLLPPIASAPAIDMAAIAHMMQDSNKQMLMGLATILKPAETQSRASMLEEISMMRNIFGGEASKENPIELFLKGIELARSLEPRGGGDTSGMDVLLESIKSFAPAITEVVKSSQIVPKKPGAQKQLPNSAPVASQAQQEPQTGDIDMMMNYYLTMLVRFAEEGRDPLLYADVVADNLSDEQIAQILTQPNVIGYLSRINAGVENNRAWFESLITELRTIMSLTDAETMDTVIPVSTEVTDNDGKKSS